MTDEDVRLSALAAELGLEVGADEFARLLREARDVVGTPQRGPGPASQLTDRELKALREAGVHADAGLDPFDRVRAKTLAQTALLQASTLTVGDVAHRLGVDRSRIRQMLADRSLIASKDGGEWRILDLQFVDDRLVANIAGIARALPEGMPLLAIANWLTMPEADLEVEGTPVSPLEWLSAGGDPERVARLASDL